MTLLQTFASGEQKLYKIKKIQIFRDIGQGDATYRKYKRLKLGGGQAYDRSND
jgi:hypothetical protein